MSMGDVAGGLLKHSLRAFPRVIALAALAMAKAASLPCAGRRPSQRPGVLHQVDPGPGHQQRVDAVQTGHGGDSQEADYCQGKLDQQQQKEQRRQARRPPSIAGSEREADE